MLVGDADRTERNRIKTDSKTKMNTKRRGKLRQGRGKEEKRRESWRGHEGDAGTGLRGRTAANTAEKGERERENGRGRMRR